LIGNLQFFLGVEAINRYAYFLQHNKLLLWSARLAMLTIVTLHAVSAIRLWLENKAARPVDYAHGKPAFGADFASRTMVVGGLIVASFVVYHLLHYTVRIEGINLGAGDFVNGPEFKEITKDGIERHDVFAMMVAGFSSPIVSLFYAVGVILLAFHLSHGLGAMCQSLGLKNLTFGPLIDKLGKVLAVALCLGYLSIPGSVLLGGYGKDYLLAKKKAALHSPAAAAAMGKEAK
jgi:succinate dehydrogenase / fumarate reductase cytochrome b subunit